MKTCPFCASRIVASPGLDGVWQHENNVADCIIGDLGIKDLAAWNKRAPPPNWREIREECAKVVENSVDESSRSYVILARRALADKIRALPAPPGAEGADREVRDAASGADWLLDAVATATQDRRFLRDDPQYDSVAGEAILLNGAAAIRAALKMARDREGPAMTSPTIKLKPLGVRYFEQRDMLRKAFEVLETVSNEAGRMDAIAKSPAAIPYETIIAIHKLIEEGGGGS